jgi:thiol-disulfide isomerase/thioredoxin
MNARGIYEIETQDQHSALLEAHPNKLIVVKFFADHCQACKALAPKYLAVKNDKQLGGLPIVGLSSNRLELTKISFGRLESYLYLLCTSMMVPGDWLKTSPVDQRGFHC